MCRCIHATIYSSSIENMVFIEITGITGFSISDEPPCIFLIPKKSNDFLRRSCADIYLGPAKSEPFDSEYS